MLHSVVRTGNSCVLGFTCLLDCTKDILLHLPQTTLKERVSHWRTGWIVFKTAGKGDVLALLSLCMLVEKHVLVHLHNNQIWTSLRDSEDSLDVIMSKVDIHLVYLGRGNFALLQKRENALQIAHRSPEIDSIVIGTFIPLSPDEDKTLNHLILSGLGFGLDRDTKATHRDLNKSSMSTSPPTKATVPETEHEEKNPCETCI